MLEPRLIVRQPFLIWATRGPTGFKGRKGRARVRLARTSAGKVGRFRKTTANGGQQKEKTAEKGARSRSYTNFAEGKRSRGSTSRSLFSGSAFRHLNAPRTSLPGLVSPVHCSCLIFESRPECPSEVFWRITIRVCTCERRRTLAIREFPVYSQSTSAFILFSTVGHHSRLMGRPAACVVRALA